MQKQERKTEADMMYKYRMAQDNATRCACYEDVKSSVSVPQWISVKERMPEDNDRVLAYFPDMNGSDCEIQISKGWALNKFVSHWMPLPTPPKGDADNG